MSISVTSFSSNTIISSAAVNSNFNTIVAAIPWNSNPIAAKGNLIVGTSALTAAALTIGTDGQVLTADSSQTTGTKWVTPSSSPTAAGTATNLGYSASVGSNNLTITLTQSDGASVPTSGSPVTVGFRNATSTTGGYTTVAVSSSIALTVPNGATLGHASAIAQYVWLYAINNGGALELAVSGVKLFDDMSIVSTTTIGAGSTSGTTMYSSTGRSNVPCKLIGRLLSTQSTAGAWASAITESSIVSGKQPTTVTDWTTYTLTIGAVTTPPTLGTTTVNAAYWRRVGDSMEIQYEMRMSTDGTDGSGVYLFPVPSGYTIDTTKVNSSTSPTTTGLAVSTVGVAGAVIGDSAASYFAGYMAVYNTSNLVMHMPGSNGPVSSTVLRLGVGGSPRQWSFRAVVPIAGWSTFGP